MYESRSFSLPWIIFIHLFLLDIIYYLQYYFRNKRRSFGDSSFIEELFGQGTKDRMVESISSWATEKVRESPGCVERFVCETYRTGESLSGLAYFLMALSK